MVWDVASVSVLAALEDAHVAAMGRRAEVGGRASVRALAWVMPAPGLLAVALSSGVFLLWDVTGMHCALKTRRIVCLLPSEMGRR